MDFITISFGSIIVLYGLYGAVMRKISPEKFVKLEAMKEKLGEAAGNRAHFFFYSVMPIIFGSIVIWAGTKGMSLSQFFSN